MTLFYIYMMDETKLCFEKRGRFVYFNCTRIQFWIETSRTLFSKIKPVSSEVFFVCLFVIVLNYVQRKLLFVLN